MPVSVVAMKVKCDKNVESLALFIALRHCWCPLLHRSICSELSKSYVPTAGVSPKALTDLADVQGR